MHAHTTGSTGTPTSCWFSQYELDLAAGYSALWMMVNLDLDSSDVMHICVNGRAAMAVYNTIHALRMVGAAAMFTGNIAPEEALARLATPVHVPGKRPKASIMSVTPSYLGALVHTGQRLGYRTGHFGLRYILCAGEVLTDALRERAEEFFGAKVTDNYAMTEIFPVAASACSAGHLHTINPFYTANKVPFTGCSSPRQRCPSHGSATVMLRTEPSAGAPLVSDRALHPDSSTSSMSISDVGAQAGAGQQFVVAEVRGDWTAIWYLGRKAWFHNPPSAPTAIRSAGRTVTPKPGRGSIKVYGWAVPEPEALPYTIPAGQRYVVGEVADAFHFNMTTKQSGVRTGGWTITKSQRTFVQLQFGHRVMFVDRDDVDLA